MSIFAINLFIMIILPINIDSKYLNSRYSTLAQGSALVQILKLWLYPFWLYPYWLYPYSDYIHIETISILWLYPCIWPNHVKVQLYIVLKMMIRLFKPISFAWPFCTLVQCTSVQRGDLHMDYATLTGNKRCSLWKNMIMERKNAMFFRQGDSVTIWHRCFPE